MDAVVDIVTGLLLIAGALFSLVAAVGILRFPDVYSRMHAASKAGTLGSGLVFLAIAVYAGDMAIFTRALAAFLFILITAPISAHLLARAAYCVGHKPWSGTKIDDLDGKYSGNEASLRCSGAK